MALESEEGIVTPDNFDDVNFVQDLAAMATSIDAAVQRRANHWIGTQAARVAFTADAPEGAFWSETTGDKGVYLKQGASWVKLWPSGSDNIHRIGGYDKNYGNVFYNMRSQISSGATRASSIQLVTNTDSMESGGTIISNFSEGVNTSTLRISHDGALAVRPTPTSNYQRITPFPYAVTKLSNPYTELVAPKSALINRVMHISYSFQIPAGVADPGSSSVNLFRISPSLAPSSNLFFPAVAQAGATTGLYRLLVQSTGNVALSGSDLSSSNNRTFRLQVSYAVDI